MNMTDYGFWSLIPPLVAIILAIITRQVFVSLGIGIILGWIIVANGNPVEGFVATADAIVDVFKNDGSTQTIIFTLLIGSLIAFIQRSGGVDGFITFINKKLAEKPGSARRVQLWAALTGILVFVESNISALTVGTLYRPLTDKLKISREKLAYLADSTSAPTSIIIPLNAWGGFIMGLLILQNIDQAFLTLVKAIPYNIYPILALVMVFYIILSGRDFGPMKKAERRAREEGKPLRDGATPVVTADVTLMEAKEGVTGRPYNMLIPIAVMVLSMPLMLIFTGWSSLENLQEKGFFEKIAEAIGYSSGAASVLYSVLMALLVSIILYLSQRVLSLKEIVSTALQGMSGMTSMALLMVLAFAIGNLCNTLGTGIYVARVTEAWLSPGLVPFIIFITSCFIAFSTGTSWGTFAIMIAIAVPVAQTMDANLPLVIAAALGGGVFGDHCSPISDTTLISSMASASDHIDHVKTQLPYALTVGILSAIFYLVSGFLL
jgi:tetracycline resistance efflux pump